MKNFLLLTILLFFTLLLEYKVDAQSNSIPVEIQSSTRQRVCLNGLWNFVPAEDINKMPSNNLGSIWVPGAWYKDAWWASCAGIEKKGTGDVWNSKLSEVNQAWYERRITIPTKWKNSAIILELSRVSTDAIIFIDGIKAGNIQWPCGELDITSYIKPGRTHDLKILVLASISQNEVMELMGTANSQAKIKPANLSSKGITGEVFLKCRPQETYIADVFVQTSVRKMELKAEIEFTGIKKSEVLTVKADVYNEKGTIEKQFYGAIELSVAKNQLKTIEWKWDNPRFWDLDQPNLYTLKLSVKSNQINDEYAQEFGFREFWTKGRDFFLNNKKINLRPTFILPGSGNYELTDSGIEGPRKAGFNFFEIWPQNIDERGMLQFNEVFMDRADRKGVLISAPLPPSTPYIVTTNWQYQWNDPGKKQEWEALMLGELKRFRNHPSVVMWGLNPNFFGHSDDQNPQVIGQRGWIKEDLGWQTHAKGGNETVEIIKKHDPTRLVFNHHGAYTGDVNTLNFYLCLSPLQERIDWLSHYSQYGNMPFMAIEFGTPLENTMLRGRSPFEESIVSEPLFTEYASIYMGKDAYKSETESYRNEIRDRFVGGQTYKKWQDNRATNYLPSFQYIESLFNRNTWQAWRTWGISGGMVPWNKAHGWIRKPSANDNVEMPEFKPGQRGTYFKTVNKGDLFYFDSTYWDILPSARALIENNNETLAWIAGSPENFTEKSHNFKVGQTVTKQIVLINDDRNALPYKYVCTVRIGNRVISTETQNGNLGCAEILKKKLEFAIPLTLSEKRLDGTIYLDAQIGQIAHRDSFSFHVFGVQVLNAQQLTCFDPVGKTGQMLRNLGYSSIPWDGKTQVPFLIIGREVLSGGHRCPGNLKEYVTKGGHLLVMTQQPEWFEKVGFRVANHLPRRVFKVEQNHQLFEAIDDVDLSDWNGESTLIEAYPDYLNREVKRGIYGVPYYGWHWGNQGALSGAALEKPHMSSWRPILECEFDLAYSPLLEMTFGKGHVVLCTLDLEDYYQKDPVAEILTSRLIEYSAKVNDPNQKMNVFYFGDESGKEKLEQMGLEIQDGSNLKELKGLLIVGNNAPVNEDAINEYIQNGGKAVVLNNKKQNSLGVSFTDKKNFNGSLNIPEWSEALGLSISDLRWRASSGAHLIVDGCEIAADGLLGRKQIGKGIVYFCQIDPDRFQADSLTYFRFTRWRQTRALCQFFSNLGCSFKSDHRFFDVPKSDIEIKLEGDWKAQLIEKMSVTLSVIGGKKDKGISPKAKSLLGFDADEQQMQSVRVPLPMEKYGEEWTNANGEVIFRKEIEIPNDMIDKDLELDLGVIHDFDETFFNGQSVGKTNDSFEEYRGLGRKYLIPAKLVKPGKNVIAIRVFDQYGSGGLLGSEKQMVLKVSSNDHLPSFYHPDYRPDFKLGDDPYRYFRW